MRKGKHGKVNGQPVSYSLRETEELFPWARLLPDSNPLWPDSAKLISTDEQSLAFHTDFSSL